MFMLRIRRLPLKNLHCPQSRLQSLRVITHYYLRSHQKMWRTCWKVVLHLKKSKKSLKRCLVVKKKYVLLNQLIQRSQPKKFVQQNPLRRFAPQNPQESRC